MKESDSGELNPPGGEVHAPDLDLLFLSKNKSEIGFITLFYTSEIKQQYEVQRLDVRDSSLEPAYPHALGIEISNLTQSDIVGANFGSGEMRYDVLTTNAELFLFRKIADHYILEFENATNFAVEIDEKPSKVEFDGRTFPEGTGWSYSVNECVLRLNTPSGSGELKIFLQSS